MLSARRDGGRGKIAVVGAASLDGARIREALAECGVPGSRVELYGAATGEAVLSEYAGEARLVQEISTDSLSASDVVFVCEPTDPSRLPREGIVLDLTGGLSGASLVHIPLRPLPEGVSRVRVPDALSIVLAEILASLPSPVRGSLASAVILRPAAAYGPAGLEELREQTVGLLRFEPPPVEVFGRTLAFNVLPDPSPAEEGTAPGGRIAREVALLLQDDAPPLTLRLATAPVFHGHLLFLRLDGAGLERGAILASLASAAGIEVVDGGTALTPVDAPDERRTVIFDLETDARGAWLVAVLGEAETAAARQAVAVAEASGRLA